jgi:hypothetical protein
MSNLNIPIVRGHDFNIIDLKEKRTENGIGLEIQDTAAVNVLQDKVMQYHSR